MLHSKTKKQTGLVLTIVLLIALLFQNLITIPHYLASVSAAVSPTDVVSAEQGEGETVPGAAEDASGALDEGTEQGATEQIKIPFKAPLLQFMANTFPYTTTAGQTVTFAELFTALGISK